MATRALDSDLSRSKQAAPQALRTRGPPARRIERTCEDGHAAGKGSVGGAFATGSGGRPGSVRYAWLPMDKATEAREHRFSHDPTQNS